MKNSRQAHAIGIPISSVTFPVERSPKGLLPEPASKHHDPPAKGIFLTGQNGLDSWSGSFVSTKALNLQQKQNKVDSLLNMINKLGKKADKFALGVRQHVKLGPKITETVKGKLRLGARILQVGRLKKVFKQLFNVREGEKLLNVCQCYLSTTAGPIAGLLFISTDKVAFCSERSIKFSSPEGQIVRIHYKVLIPLRKINRANQSENVKNPSVKYMEIVTVDDFDFWFMGFLNYQKAFKHLQRAISQSLNEVQVTQM